MSEISGVNNLASKNNVSLNSNLKEEVINQDNADINSALKRSDTVHSQGEKIDNELLLQASDNGFEIIDPNELEKEKEKEIQEKYGFETVNKADIEKEMSAEHTVNVAGNLSEDDVHEFEAETGFELVDRQEIARAMNISLSSDSIYVNTLGEHSYLHKALGENLHRFPKIEAHLKKAQNVPLNFLVSVKKSIKSARDIGHIYDIARSSNEQDRTANLAFADLLFVDCWIKGLSKKIKNQNLIKDIYVNLLEIITSDDKKSLDEAITSLNLNINSKSQNYVYKKSEQEAMKQFVSEVNCLYLNKSQFLSEFKEISDKISDIKENFDDFDLNEKVSTEIRYFEQNQHNGIPSEVGTGFVNTSGDKQEQLDKLKENIEFIKEQQKLYNEIRIQLEKPEFRSENIAALKEKAFKSGYKNKSFVKLFDDYTAKTKNNFLEKVNKEISSSRSGPEIAQSLRTINEKLQRDLPAKEQLEVYEQICKNIQSLDNQNNQDLIYLQTVSRQVLDNKEFLKIFPAVITLLSDNDFKSADIRELTSQLGKPEDSVENNARAFLSSLKDAVDNPDHRQSFMLNVIDAVEKKPGAMNFALNVLEFMHYLDPARCSHIDDAFFNQVQIKTFFDNLQEEDKQKILSAKDNDPDILPQAQDNAENAVDDKNRQMPNLKSGGITALKKIVTGSFKDITSTDYKRVMYSVDSDENLKILSPIWQRFVNAAWNQSLIEANNNEITSNDATHLNVQRNTATGYLETKENELQKTFIEEVNTYAPERMEKTFGGVGANENMGRQLSKLSSRLNANIGGSSTITNAIKMNTREGRKQLAFAQLCYDIAYLNGSSGKLYTEYLASTPEELINYKGRHADHHSMAEFTNRNLASIGKVEGYLMSVQEAKDDREVKKVVETNKKILQQNGKTLTDEKNILRESSKVVTTFNILSFGLIDDILLYSDENLKKLGIKDPSSLRISKEDLKTFREYQINTIKENRDELNSLKNETEIALLTGTEKKGQEKNTKVNPKIAVITQKLDKALSNLKTLIEKEAKGRPLAFKTQLLVKKYAELFSLRNCSEMALISGTEQASELTRGDARFLSPETYEKNPQTDPDTGKTLSYDEYCARQQELAAQQSFANASEIARENGIFSGRVHENNDKIIENMVVSTLIKDCGLTDSDDMYELIRETVFDKKPLNTEDKKTLLANVGNNYGNLDFNAVGLESEDGNGIGNKISDILSQEDDASFNEKITDFINTELSADNAKKGDKVLFATIIDETDPKVLDTLVDKGKLFGDKPSEALNKIYAQTKGSLNLYLDSNRSLQQEKHKIESSWSQNQAFESTYNHPDVQANLRIAAGYAGSKTGVGIDAYDVFHNYHSLSDEDKKITFDYMLEAMQTQGYDRTIAHLLLTRKLRDGSATSLASTVFQGLRNLATTLVNMVVPGQKEAQKNIQKLETLNAQSIAKELLANISTDSMMTLSRDMHVGADPGQLLSYCFKETLNLPVNINAALMYAKKTGLVIQREKNGKIRLYADLNKFGLKLQLGAYETKNNVHGEIGLNANIQRQNVHQMSFDNDDEATLFIAKMITGSLTDDDVRIASAHTTGTKTTYGGGLKISFGAAPFQDFGEGIRESVNGAPSNIIDSAYSHAIGFVGDSLKDIAAGKVGVGLQFSHQTSETEDINGITQTRQSSLTLDLEGALISQNKKGFVKSAGNILIDEIVKNSTSLDKQDQVMDKTNKIKNNISRLNEPKSTVNIFSTSTEIHYPVSGQLQKIPDRVKETSVFPVLTASVIRDIKELGVFSAEGINELEKLMDSDINGKVGPVKIIRQLKPEAIKMCHDNPQQIDRIISDRSNYEFAGVDIEIEKSAVSSPSTVATLVNTCTFGIIPFEDTATVQNKTVLTYRKGILQN